LPAGISVADLPPTVSAAATADQPGNGAIVLESRSPVPLLNALTAWALERDVRLADLEVRRYLGPLLTFEQAAAWLLNYQGGVAADRHDHRSR
jgi:uncharacterized protein YbjT (DUF2867 family)